MQQKSLMAHLLDKRFIKEHENVANSGIEHLLNEYAEAREALRVLLEVDVVPKSYQAEKVLESGNRPDVVGTDANGDMTVMIEGKFGAPLADGQAESYLEYLPANGKLLLLCRSDRKPGLDAELEKLNDNRIMVRRWLELLKLMEKGGKNRNPNMINDVFQLKAFCERLDEKGVPVFSEVDTDPVNRVSEPLFKNLLVVCQSVLKGKEGLADFSRNTNWASSDKPDFRFGFYFYLGKRIECYVHFSRAKWIRHSVPIWLNMTWDRCEKNAEHKRAGTKKLAQALKEFEPENTDGNDIKIIIKTDVSEDEVVDDIVARVNEILKHIKDKHPND